MLIIYLIVLERERQSEMEVFPSITFFISLWLIETDLNITCEVKKFLAEGKLRFWSRQTKWKFLKCIDGIVQVFKKLL